MIVTCLATKFLMPRSRAYSSTHCCTRCRADSDDNRHGSDDDDDDGNCVSDNDAAADDSNYDDHDSDDGYDDDDDDGNCDSDDYDYDSNHPRMCCTWIRARSSQSTQELNASLLIIVM